MFIGLAVLCFCSKTGFWPWYCQISTELDKFLYTSIVVRKWADLDRDHDFRNATFFDLRRKITKLSRENGFRTVAAPGACGVFSTP